MTKYEQLSILYGRNQVLLRVLFRILKVPQAEEGREGAPGRDLEEHPQAVFSCSREPSCLSLHSAP